MTVRLEATARHQRAEGAEQAPVDMSEFLDRVLREAGHGQIVRVGARSPQSAHYRDWHG